jgi:hypothetical protein
MSNITIVFRRLSAVIFFLLIINNAFAQNAAVRGFYLSQTHIWLGDTAQENTILRYAAGNGFNYVTLYDLHRLSWTTQVKKSLASFIKRAHTQYGITQVGAAGETYSTFINYIIPYNNGRNSSSERFNVLNLEFEFWIANSVSSYYCNQYLVPNGYNCDSAGAFAFAWKEFQKIDSLCAAKNLVSEIYLGWPTQGQMQKIASRADRILLHAYRPSDVDVYAYSRGRLNDISSAGTVTKVLPIFSSEPLFMNSWLATHPITQPFITYASKLSTDSVPPQNIDLNGYQWFIYKYMPATTINTVTIAASGPLNICTGSVVTLTAPISSAYLWSPGGQTTRSISVNAAGSYTCRVTNTLGMIFTSAPVNVTVSAAGAIPVISASGPTSFCNGSSVTLTSSIGGSYLWSNGATTSSITVTATGSYKVTTTNNGCVATSSAVNVTSSSVAPTPTVTASSSLNICPGSLLTLTSSQGDGYLWSTGQTTRSIVVSAAGNYSVNTFSGPSCSSVSAVQNVTLLTAPSTPVITPASSTTLTSTNQSVVLSSSPASTYNWSSGETTSAITVTSQGSYRVTVGSSNGCTKTSAAVTVSANGCTPPPVPTISLSGSNILTAGQTVTLTSSVAGGYLWSTGATTQSITVSAAGTFTVRNYNAGYCYSTSLPVSVLLVASRVSETEIDPINSFDIFPNPASDKLNVKINLTDSKMYKIILTDIAGRQIYSEEKSGVEGVNNHLIDISLYSPGLYFCIFLSEEWKKSQRLIIR